MKRSVQTYTYRAMTQTLSPNILKRDSTTHVTYEFHRVRLKLFMSRWYVLQTMHLSYVKLPLSPNELNRAPPNPHDLGVPPGASKTIYERTVRLTQTEHLSCTDANAVSKQIERRFHLTLILFRAYGTFDVNRGPIWHLG
jgi:hypothetical protein